MKRTTELGWIALLAVAVCLTTSVASAGLAEVYSRMHLSSESLEVFQRGEIIVAGVPDAANPFDPECVSLELQVTDPSDKTFVVPGFFLSRLRAEIGS